MSTDTNGVEDRTSGDIIGVPCESEGLLCCEDVAGLVVGEEVASAEEGLWVAIEG